MGIFSGLFKSRDKPQNSYDSPSYTYFFGRANSGKRVTDRTALQHIAVYACVRVLSEAIAQLPLHVYQYDEEETEESPKEDPDEKKKESTASMLYTPSKTLDSFLQKISATASKGTPINQLDKRLELLKY